MERGRDRCGDECGGESVWVSGISGGGEEKGEGGLRIRELVSVGLGSRVSTSNQGGRGTTHGGMMS